MFPVRRAGLLERKPMPHLVVLGKDGNRDHRSVRGTMMPDSEFPPEAATALNANRSKAEACTLK